MNIRKRISAIRISLLLLVVGLAQSAYAQDPLPSWNDSDRKSAIIEFVQTVTDRNSKGFVPAAERIATFDNDGTLWAEQPLYFQLLWALDGIREMAPDHPEWKTTEPYKSALAGDMKGVMAGGEEAVLKILVTPHVNVTSDEFHNSVADWLATSKHPTTGLPYTKMIFQPMLELVNYLAANEFKVYIVSGGGIDFIRVFSEEVYGIPPEHVVGSTLDAKYEVRDGQPVIIKEGKIMLIDDKAGKPVGIYRHIGRKPIFAAGNSDGDYQMLEYTTTNRDVPTFGLYIHHTDSEREFAYDRKSSIGGLAKGLDDADAKGWHVVDMKKDWKQVYPK